MSLERHWRGCERSCAAENGNDPRPHTRFTLPCIGLVSVPLFRLVYNSIVMRLHHVPVLCVQCAGSKVSDYALHEQTLRSQDIKETPRLTEGENLIQARCPRYSLPTHSAM